MPQPQQGQGEIGMAIAHSGLCDLCLLGAISVLNHWHHLSSYDLPFQRFQVSKLSFSVIIHFSNLASDS